MLNNFNKIVYGSQVSLLCAVCADTNVQFLSSIDCYFTQLQSHGTQFMVAEFNLHVMSAGHESYLVHEVDSDAD